MGFMLHLVYWILNCEHYPNHSFKAKTSKTGNRRLIARDVRIWNVKGKSAITPLPLLKQLVPVRIITTIMLPYIFIGPCERYKNIFRLQVPGC